MNHIRQVLGYKVMLEPDVEGGFFVIVPALPGCGSQGKTEDECAENVADAIDAVLRVRNEDRRCI